MTELLIRSTAARAHATRRANDALSRFVETLQSWRRRSRERDELARLSEYKLHDIGLSRSMIAVEVEKPFWQE